jgi:hypothetical protein
LTNGIHSGPATSNTGDTYLASTKYDEAGRILSMGYGASVIQKVFTYFPYSTATQGGLLNTAIATRLADSATLQNFAYTYDKNANVATILDNVAGPQTQTFGYDSLNRLISAEVTSGTNGLYNETYTYDANTGNLASKAGVNYTTYDPAHPNAQTLPWGEFFSQNSYINTVLPLRGFVRDVKILQSQGWYVPDVDWKSIYGLAQIPY